jgi:threonine dehydratase
VTEFNYRISDAAQAHVFVGLTTHGKGESGKIAANFSKHGFATLDLTHDELAKEHIRHMVGGIRRWRKDERLLRFMFPERPGALMKFLSLMRPGWNISLFHYRNQGADYGRILVGLQVPKGRRQRHSVHSWTPWVIPTWKKPTTLFTDCFCRRSM